MHRVVAKEAAIRELVRGALDAGDSKLTTDEPANVNPTIDPLAVQTDPINPNYVPRTKQELDLSVKNLVKNLPNDKMPGIYRAIKQAIDADKEITSKEETMDDTQGTNAKNHVEEAVRKAVRSYLIDKKVKAALTEAPDPADVQADAEEGEFDGEGKPRKFSTMTDVSGGTFEEIAKELSFSVAGAKQAVDKALKKAQFLGKIDKDELDIMVLTTMNDYITMLAKTGELSAADVQLMKDHPDIVRELDGFREYLHNAVRRMRKTMGDDDTVAESTSSRSRVVQVRDLRNKRSVLSEANRSKKIDANGVTLRLNSQDPEWNVLETENGKPVARQSKRSAGRVFQQGTNPDYEGRDSFKLEYTKPGGDTWHVYNTQARKGDITNPEFLDRIASSYGGKRTGA